MKNSTQFKNLLHPSANMIWQIIISAMMFVSGCLCFIFAEKILDILPFVLGSILVLLSLFRFHQVFEDKKFSRDEAFIAGNGSLYLVLGIIILIKNRDAYYLIGIVWGMLGLIRDSRNFTALVFRLLQKEEKIKEVFWNLAYCIFGISISILLLLDPPEHLHFHIMVLGLEFFDSSFRILRDGVRFDSSQGII